MLRSETVAGTLAEVDADASGPRLTAAPSPRSAATCFVREATLGWGRRELAEWLMCHYGACVIHERDPGPADSASENTLAGGESPRTEVRPPHVIESSVVELVERVRARMFVLLHDLGGADQIEAGRITAAMIDSRRVVERRIGGALVWAPVHRPRLRLVERVTALFVTDYLNTPRDYRDVRACERCGAIAFGVQVTHGRGCPAAFAPGRRDSHVAVRRDGSTVSDESDADTRPAEGLTVECA
jgi:hypothetical protein